MISRLVDELQHKRYRKTKNVKEKKFKKLRYRDLIILSQQIQNMYLSGCDVFTILDTIIYSSNERISKSCREVRRNLEEGLSFSQSFSKTNLFPKFFSNMVYAGEVSGRVDKSFHEIGNYYSREEKIRNKLINSLIYPIILLIVSFIAINIVFTFVIPNFQNSFLSDGIEVAILTKIIFKISEFIRKYGIILYILIAIGIGYCIYSFKKDRKKRIFIEKNMMKIPMYKKISTTIVSEKFSRILSSLLDSGINVGEAISISIVILDKPILDKKLSEALKNIEEGKSISYSLNRTGIFPRMFISMIESGEASGHFVESLNMVSDFYKKELDNELEKFLRLIEPMLILIMGVVIGTVMIGLMYPIMNTISNIS